MADTEDVVRRIVERSDVNVITRRLVREQYSKLTGIGTLSTDTKMAINEVLDVIIAEIAQKMVPEKTVINDKRLQNENSTTNKVLSQSLIDKNKEMRTKSVCTQSSGDQQDRSPQTVCKESFIDPKVVTRPPSIPMFINKSIDEDEKVPANGRLKHKYTEKSFVLMYPLTNKVLKQRQICTKNAESKSHLMTAPVALMHVLNSDDASSDNSLSAFFNSPQKQAATGDRLLKGLNVRGSPGRGVKRNVSACDSLNTDERNDLKTDVIPYKKTKTCDYLNTEGDLETDVTPVKKNKTCGLDFGNACIVNTDCNLVPTHSILKSEREKNVYLVSSDSSMNFDVSPFNSNGKSVNQRHVQNFYKELYSKSGISYTPDKGCGRSGSLDFLNGQKCRQDCAIDSSLDNYDTRLPDANVLTNLDNKDKFNENLKREKEVACVLVQTSSENEGYQESCVNSAKGKERQGLDDCVKKQAAETVFLSAEEGLKSSSSGPSTDALFGSEVASIHQRGVEVNSHNFVPTTQIKSSVSHDSTSSDSSSCLLNIRRRSKLKIRGRKCIFDDSESDFQLSDSLHKSTKPNCIDSESDSQLFGSLQKNTWYKPKCIDSESDCKLSGRPKKNTSYKHRPIGSESDSQFSGSPQKNKLCKPKRNGKDAIVMIKTVNMYDSDVEVIKYAVMSDSELLESIECTAQKFSLCKRRERKSSGSKHVKSKKQASKMLNSETCNDLDKSLESFSCSESLDLSHDLNRTSKSTESSVYDLSNDDEYNVPLSKLNSYRKYSAERNALNCDRKCSVAITTKEKEITDCDNYFSNYIESTNQLDPMLQGCQLNSLNTNIRKSFQNNTCHDNDVGQKEGSDLNGSKKSCQEKELANLRIICQKVGLFLRNSVELAGCSTNAEKVTRVKKLLNERGMQGKPSLRKVEKVNLLKEMKELQHDTILVSQIKGKPSLRKVEKVNLLKEMKELQHDTILVSQIKGKPSLRKVEKVNLLKEMKELQHDTILVSQIKGKPSLRKVEKVNLLKKMKELQHDTILVSQIKGKPSLRKVEKVNLLKEIKELQHDTAILVSQTEGRRRNMNERSFGTSDDSYRQHHSAIHANTQDLFSELKDIIIIDDSD